MKAGRFIGIALAIIGVVTVTFSLSIITTLGAVPKIVVCGPAIGIVGLAMIIFPGGDITLKELSSKVKPRGFLWTDAPISHKLIWIVTFIMGVVISIYQMETIGVT